MKHFFKLTRTALCLMGVLTSWSTQAAMYSISDLGTLNGYVASSGRDINDAGQVAGFVRDADGFAQAFIYTPGAGMVGLGTLGGASSFAYAINDSGVTVGMSSDASGVAHAFVYGDAGMTDLTPGQAANSIAYDINNAGQVAGSSGNKPFMTNSAGEIGLLNLNYPGWGGTTSNLSGGAYSINDQGQTAGVVNFNIPANYYSLAFVSDANGVGVPLSGINLGTQSQGNAINDVGLVAGYMMVNGVSQAALFDDGVVTSLGALCSGGFSGASDINNLGQIVGNSQDCGASAGNRRGFLYENGQMVDLNSLLRSNDADSWFILSASAINESGQITGEALMNGQLRAYVMTPVPEPSTLGLMALGLLGVVAARKRLLDVNGPCAQSAGRRSNQG